MIVIQGHQSRGDPIVLVALSADPILRFSEHHLQATSRPRREQLASSTAVLWTLTNDGVVVPLTP